MAGSILARGLILAVWLAAASEAQAQSAWYEGFEGPEPSWRLMGGNAQYQIQAHGRIRGGYTGQACEHLMLVGNGGTHVYIGHPVGRPWVIRELSPTVQVRSDRGGLQFLAQVVLPRSQDPRTGRPLATILAGSTYTDIGRWQQLRIDGIPQLLAANTRALRAEFGPGVDPREAYVENVLLNIYGGPGVTNVWIDDLDIGGYVGVAGNPGSESLRDGNPAPTDSRPAGTPSQFASLPQAPAASADASWRSATAAAGAPAGQADANRRVRMDLSMLLVDNRPFFPRVIEYQGEPLALLARMGFNAVWLPRLPTRDMAREAAQLGLWLIAPPPQPSAEPSPDGQEVPLAPFGSELDGVLAWDLGRGLYGEQLDRIGRWAEMVRAADRRLGRPLVLMPETDLRSYSRRADLLIIGRQPLAGSLELSDYGAWLGQRARLARPGTPFWTTVQTQAPESLAAQWQTLAPGAPPAMSLSGQQVRLLTYTALTSGSRGLLFQSASRLDANDPDTRSRAMVLELLNLELSLIEPWLAAGTYVTTVQGSQPDVIGVVLRTDRARLLVPLWTGRGSQCVPGQAAGNGISFVVPGVPEEYEPSRLLPGALQPIRLKRREAGGTRVALEEFALTSGIVLTQDPLITSSITQRARQIGPRAADLQRALAQAELDAFVLVDGQLHRSPPTPDSKGQLPPDTVGAVRKNLEWCEGYLKAKDYASAYLHAERAMRPIRILERQRWEGALGRFGSPAASPSLASFWTLPIHWQLMDRLARMPMRANSLAGGDFEDLGVFLETGWNRFQHPPQGISPEADLARVAAHSGQMGLRLAAAPAAGADPQAVVETAPVWISSPAIPVDPGTLAVIHGWVNVPAAISGSVDGLMVIDSLTGEPLALRFAETAGWREFTMLRVAPQSTGLSLTFALTGLGEAWIDDVTVQLSSPAPTPTPTLAPPLANASTPVPSQSPDAWRPTYGPESGR